MRSAGKASIPRFAPMPPGVDVAVTASTPPKSFRSRPMWPIASIVGAPCRRRSPRPSATLDAIRFPYVPPWPRGSRTRLPVGVPQIPEAGTGRNRPRPPMLRAPLPGARRLAYAAPQGGAAMAQTASRMTIAPIHPCFGARVEGVDLGEPLDTATFQQIFDAFQEYSVLVFHGQRLTDETQMAFSRRFGPLETTINATGRENRLHPNLVDLSNTDPERDGGLMDWTDRRMLYQSGNQLWHTDSSFKPVPAMASLLSGREVPPVGGETEFASMRHAYRTLPEATRQGLEGKVVVHSILYSRSTIAKGLFDPEHEKGLPPVRQALVRTNPVNGRKAVYVGSHAWYVEGMPDQESRRLLDELLAHATRPASVYTHRWRPWDLVMWDTRSVLHRGRPGDAARPRRFMRRPTIAGDGPTVDPPFARRTAAWEGIIPEGVQ